MRAALEAAAAAWTGSARGRRRLRALRAVCDTYIPSVRAPAGADPADGFWVRRASDLRTEYAAAGWIETKLPPADRDGIVQLLDLLGATGFHRLPVAARARLIAAAPRESEVARGFRGLRELAFAMYYSVPLEDGTNPNWTALGYPGPPEFEPPAQAPRITPERPEGDEASLDADVCIVGSGSGGGVLAATLAQAGLDVVVLEAGGHYEPHNYPAHEVDAYDALYWRNGWKTSDDGNILIGAGGTLGGGSAVNWMNCVQPPDRLREEWAEHGLKDLATSAFDEHLEAVSQRISRNADCSDRNGPNERMVSGADALGWSWTCADRNSDRETYAFESAGFIGYGDRSDSKQSTAATYLPDAAAAGARILVDTSARRILTRNGRATGVEAVRRSGERLQRITVNAPTVVVAGGALETPALLLRSQLGGPAVGANLHIHPTTGVAGLYQDGQDPWLGAPHTAIIKEFATMSEGYGFLIEGMPWGPAFNSVAVPVAGGRTHKLLVSQARKMVLLIGLVRDRGSGRVTIDEAGEPFVEYQITDPLDELHVRAALDAMARLHQAAGARVIFDSTIDNLVLWQRGEPLDTFVDRATRGPLRIPHRIMATAHQMSTARMGTDPRSSVADPEGRLHDVRGVWIGDTSAFPTASGVNPMVTCMALARRTAHAILADVG